ncbi:hypothetical protein CNECB9_4870048 [Cupriavidus necator]|uniref:Uncharacterized protein n=1 Tax=Cupriavidus necator TaxID=106590 RepID=A0A1K0JUN0_CUPNE|nr:hypothetical protein CNECB9_4870048 [Cupriavidus necator]
MHPPDATVVIISPALRKANHGDWQTANQRSRFLRGTTMSGRRPIALVRVTTPPLAAEYAASPSLPASAPMLHRSGSVHGRRRPAL